MRLKHNEFVIGKPANEVISEAVQNRTSEINLAVSLPFDYNSYEFDWDDSNGYDEYFSEFIREANSFLGMPVFQGTYASDGFKEWMKRVCPRGCADNLAVWKVESMMLYVRFSWFDKEAPILIALGAEGCKRDRRFEFDNSENDNHA